MNEHDPVVAFVRWTWMRALLHNGWWLVASVYLVVDAGLSASQIVLIGSVQGIFALCCEVPAGVLAVPLTRIIGVIWVNARTTSDVRATTHSFLAQAEYLGEVTCGLAIALIADLFSLPLALAGCAALFALTAGSMRRVRKPAGGPRRRSGRGGRGPRDP
jgi:hypothetical protein